MTKGHDQAAWTAIQSQISRLNPQELEQFLRILRRAKRLDRQLADLHLRWPAIEIRFYGISQNGHTAHDFSPDRLLGALQKKLLLATRHTTVQRKGPSESILASRQASRR